MASTVKIKRSSVAGKKPTTSDISAGELALNTKDFKLFSSNGSTIFELANAGALANTNLRINLINTNLTGTNTALRTLISDRLQVSNAATIYQTKAVERAALANTNARINLINTNLTGTNTSLRTLISDRLQVANASTLYATKSNPTTSGLLAHTGRVTISTNLAVSGNTTLGAAGKFVNIPGSLLQLNGTDIRATFAANSYVKTILANTNSYIATRASWAALTSTNTALRTLISDRLQVANAATIYQTKSVERAALANTNARINLINTNLTGTNTSLRTLISDRLQVSNASAIYQTKAVERAALANTNARINLINTNLTGTNTALRTLISDRLQVSNASATYQTKAVERAALANTNLRINLINTNLTGTNTSLRTLISDRLQVANASTLYTTKSNPTTSGLLAHTGRATISTNLAVTGNTTIAGLRANNTLGTAGQVLKTNGTTVYWDVDNSGGSGGLVSTTTATVKNLTQNDVVVTGVTAAVSTNYLQVANAVATYATKTNPTTSGLLAHTGRATISTNLDVTGNTTIAGLRANNTLGTADQVLKTNGTTVYWGTAAGGGGSSANGFSGILVGANVIAADSSTDRLTLTAGSKISLAANPTTDTITIQALTTEYLQVANAATIYQTKAVERAALANTNARINLINTNLTGTNTALRTLISDRLQVSNASTLYATKSNPTTSGLLAHTGRVTISTNLAVSGNASITGTSTFTGAATFRQTSTQDAIIISGRAGGTSTYGVTITPTTLSANRTLTVPDADTTIVGNDTTQTLTNKRVNSRVVAAAATSGNLTINGDTTDVFNAFGLTGAITFLTPSGTPVDGQKLIIRVEDNGTARGITWTTTSGAFRAVGITLPTTTVAGKITYVGCVYNTTDTFWDAIAVATQA